MPKSMQYSDHEDDDIEVLDQESTAIPKRGGEKLKNGPSGNIGGANVRGCGRGSIVRGGGARNRGSMNNRGGTTSRRGRTNSPNPGEKTERTGELNPAKKSKLDTTGSSANQSSKPSHPLTPSFKNDDSREVEITMANKTMHQLSKKPNGSQDGKSACNELSSSATLVTVVPLRDVCKTAPGTSRNVQVGGRQTKDPNAVNVHQAAKLPVVVAVDNPNIPEPVLPPEGEASCSSSDVFTQNLSFSWAHLTQNRSTTNKLLMEAWCLTGSNEAFEKSLVTFGNDSSLFDNLLCRFLEGEKQACSADEFLDFLNKRPENIVGNFIVALMIVQYVAEMEVECLAVMFKNQLQDDHPFHAVFETMLLYKIQRGIRCNKMGFKLIEICPAKLWDNLNYDMINRSNQVNGLMANQRDFKETREESSHLENVRSLLQRMIFADMKSETHCLLDAKTRTFKTAELWLRVLNLVIRQMPEDNRECVFQMLVTVLRETDTRVYFYYKKDTKWEPVRLNPVVLGLWVTNPLQRGEQIDEDESTVETFVEMIYDIMDAMPLDKRVKPGVYRLAKRLKICDIYQFVFKGKTYKDLIDESNKVQLLHLLIKLERNNELDEIATRFDTWIPAKQRSMFLDGLDAEEVVSFMGRKCLRLEENEVYELLLKWSFESCKKEYPKNKIYYDDAVNAQFQLVRSAIFLMDIKDYAALIRHRYISYGEILQAKSLLTSFTNEESSSNGSEFWFSVGHRTNKDGYK